MIKTVKIKGRVRKNRGLLKSFDELSKEKKVIFEKIKNITHKIFGREINVYVFGSYYWGYWDELSDFDVALDFEFRDRISEIKEIILTLKKLGIESDIQVKRFNKSILIP